jgi:hypothetical protein
MVYSDYIKSLSPFKKQNLTTEQRTFLFKLLSGHDQSFKIKSYLKLRNSTQEGRDPTSLISNYLEEIGFLEITKGKFLSSSKNFRFTTFGLFHILLDITIYPPQFLIKYKDDIIIKTLVYQFFEEKTIKMSTGRFYSHLTSYIQECCNLTMNAIEDINTSSKEEDKLKITNRLKFDLEWMIRRLGFKFIIMYNDTNLLALNPELKDEIKISIYELESKMKGILSNDEKFIDLIKNLNKDFSEGYKEIMIIHQDNIENQNR